MKPYRRLRAFLLAPMATLLSIALLAAIEGAFREIAGIPTVNDPSTATLAIAGLIIGVPSLYAVSALVGVPLVWLPVPSYATTIVGVRTAKEINIGVDSRLTVIARDGSPSYRDGCKIVQVGNIFSAAEGPFKGSGYDVQSFLVKAHSLGGDIY